MSTMDCTSCFRPLTGQLPGRSPLARQAVAASQSDLRLTKQRYGVGCSWELEEGRPKVDLDLQCVVVDDRGAIVDCAYYNNLKAVRAITHSGDVATADDGSGIKELVWVHFNKVPANVSVLVFVIAAYSGGKLRDVSNGYLHVLEERKEKEVRRLPLEQSHASVDVVAVMYRSGAAAAGFWSLREIEEPAQQGQHFMDILPLISTVVRRFIPHAPQKQKVAFAMEKGGILDLPRDLAAITVGLGWDTDEGEVDLDVSAVLLDSSGGEVETVFFGNLESVKNGILHTGDNLTGEGEGDDEQIKVNLARIEDRVQQVVFVINIYTDNRTFRQVANPYCRVVDEASRSELCRYSLREAGGETGLIVSKIAREAGQRWGFHAIGLPCRGKTYKDSLPHIQQVCSMDTRKLMSRGHTTSDISSDVPADQPRKSKRSMGPAAPLMPIGAAAPPVSFAAPAAAVTAAAPGGAAPPDAKQQKCCILQ